MNLCMRHEKAPEAHSVLESLECLNTELNLLAKTMRELTEAFEGLAQMLPPRRLDG